MVFVKVREVYDLHTVQGKMSVISIHTPDAKIIKRNYPGLLMQCKAYRPVSCDVKVACASVMPLDPAGVGLSGEGVVAPEDLFNPILYKACTNFGMSQIEARICANAADTNTNLEVDGSSVAVDNDSVIPSGLNDFDIYYGFLSDTHSWKHAAPQSGFSMDGLRPLVYEVLTTVGDISHTLPRGLDFEKYRSPQNANELNGTYNGYTFKGNAKPMPMMNTGIYIGSPSITPGYVENSLTSPEIPQNAMTELPAPIVNVAGIIVPPSKLHSLYYRMVVEWTLEFSMIRSFQEITNYSGLAMFGDKQHYMSYSYPEAKKILGVEGDALTNDTCMVSTNADIEKVM